MKTDLPSCTVGYLLRGKEVLLGKKAATPKAVKRKIAGKWLGYGGDIEKTDASIRHSFVRELSEESPFKAKPEDAEVKARILIRDEHGDRLILYYLLLCRWQGEAGTSREFNELRWFPESLLPEDLLGADKLVLPRIFQGESLGGFVEYDKDMNVVSYEIVPLKESETKQLNAA